MVTIAGSEFLGIHQFERSREEMDKIERLAGRLAHDCNRLAFNNLEEALEAAPLLRELTNELAAEVRASHCGEPSGEALFPDREDASMTVLLVEAESEERSALCGMLIERGYRVLESGAGADALRFCHCHPGPVRLLLTDMLLPDMSGRELAERASLLRPGMTVIYMSGYADDEILSCGLLLPGMTVLKKPVTAAALADKLTEVLECQLVVIG